MDLEDVKEKITDSLTTHFQEVDVLDIEVDPDYHARIVSSIVMGIFGDFCRQIAFDLGQVREDLRD